MLVVLVVKDGGAWLKSCLASLASQTHPRVGLIAVDNGSEDGSWKTLAAAIGRERVLRLETNVGFPAAVASALALPIAAQADYYLLLHDDTVLAPDAIERLVESATRIRGAGVVGPKVLDAARSGFVREVGLITDRFGYPSSPLEDEEIDQGQYDAIREVLFVSTTAMLVARDAWARADGLDERLGTGHADLDFCWRVRLSGFRVVVDPRATVRHIAAAERGIRPGWSGAHGRYLAERAGLLALLKNYRLPSLLWVLPLYFLQGIVKVGLFLVLRRFATAGQVVRAWGWNLVHLPGTIRRRVRGHSVREVKDGAVVRFMAPAGARVRRLILQGSSILVGKGGGIADEEEEEVRPDLRRRVSSFLVAHPVALGWIAALIVSLVAFRDVLFGPQPTGGALPAFPAHAGAFFNEFGSAWHSVGFGGAGPASPALIPLGAASFLALGDPGLLARLLVAAGPILAAVACYRATLRVTGERVASVTAAACYALSALTMWTVSEGRLPAMVFLIGLPLITVRLFEAFERAPERPVAWLAGTGIALAFTAAFFPSVWIPTAITVVAAALFAHRPRDAARGLVLGIGAAAAAVLLVLPFVFRLLGAGDVAPLEAAGDANWSWIARLAPGRGPGTWGPAYFLPLAGVLGLGLSDDRRRAWRAGGIALVCLPMAWLAAADRLPPALGNPVAFLGLASFMLCLLVARTLSSLVPGVGRQAFGYRQVAFAGLAIVLGGGLFLQTLQAIGGGWAVGRDRLPPAWPVVSTAEPGVGFRVLWLGAPGGRAFPPPGGVPDGEVGAAAASVRYGITTKAGHSALALVEPADGPGYRRLEEVLADILNGKVRHGGASLATLGIRYVVSGEEDLPRAARRSLAAQIDLDLVQRAGGLRVYRSAVRLPEAWVRGGRDGGPAVRSTDAAGVATLAREASPLRRVGDAGWTGPPPAEGGVAAVAVAYHSGWKAGGAAPFRAFGWSPGFDVAAGAPIRIGFDGGWRRGAELAYLLVVWAAALWLRRRRTETP